MRNNNWARLLAYVTGVINQQLLLQNEYLAAENRILRAHLPTRLRLSGPQRCTLAEIGKRLGRKALQQVACVAKPDTILAWYRRLVARKFDGSRSLGTDDRFFTDDYRPEIYTQEGLDYIQNNGLVSVLKRHFPELAPAMEGTENPFAPWNAV